MKIIDEYDFYLGPEGTEQEDLAAQIYEDEIDEYDFDFGPEGTRQEELITQIYESRMVPKDLSKLDIITTSKDGAYFYVDDNGKPVRISTKDIAAGAIQIVEEEPEKASVGQIILLHVNSSENKYVFEEKQEDGWHKLYPVSQADIIEFNNETSNLESTNVQDAIDELDSEVIYKDNWKDFAFDSNIAVTGYVKEKLETDNLHDALLVLMYCIDSEGEIGNVTITKTEGTGTEGPLAIYTINQSGKAVSGPTINIPKDYVLKSATVKICMAPDSPISGLKVGDKYIDFVINAKTNDGIEEHVYLDARLLVETYSVDSEGTEVQLFVESTGPTTKKFSASLVEDSIAQEKLKPEIRTILAQVGTNTTNIASLNTDLGTEVLRATTAESLLTNWLDSEGNIRASADITLNSRINNINEKIPSQASSTNQLADKDFVNSSIEKMAANYVTYDINGNSFPTKAALINATIVYHGGQEYEPKKNDYAMVLNDESHDNYQSRYIFVKSTASEGVWNFQYTVKTTFTAEQQAAIDSGITTELVGQITTNKNDITDLEANKADQTTLTEHKDNKANPHTVTKSQVGLSNVDNTSDINKPISTATQTALNLKANTTYVNTELSKKQDTISDLSTIRSNASAGKSASSIITTYGNIVTHNTSEFATASQGSKADSAIQPLDNVSKLKNDAGYLTEHQSLTSYSTTTEMNTAINNHHDSSKQDVISDIDTIRSGAALGATAMQPNTTITAATKTKITYDAKGLVTGGANLSASDIPNLDTSKITSGTFNAARIPNLDASKINSGTFSADRIPSLSLSKISDVTATATELNVLDGITASTAELNYTKGVTSNIQTQLNTLNTNKQNNINSSNKLNSDYLSEGPTNKLVSAAEKTTWNNKQNELSSVNAGTGISITTDLEGNKVINNTQTSAEWGNITGTLSSQTDLQSTLDNKVSKVEGKGLSTNDFTDELKAKYNGYEIGKENADTTILKQANVVNNLISTSTNMPLAAKQGNELKTLIDGKQATLVSGTNIKTINNESLLGSNNISVQTPIDNTTNLTAQSLVANLLTGGLSYSNTVPTSANTNGLKFVVLTSEPTTKYDGYVYIITEA